MLVQIQNSNITERLKRGINAAPKFSSLAFESTNTPNPTENNTNHDRNNKNNVSSQDLLLEKKEKRRKNTLQTVKIVVLTALCLLIGLKGTPRKLRSKLDQANKNIIDKNAKIGEGKKGGLMFYAREGIRRIMGYSKATFNLAPLKDVVIGRIMNKYAWSRKLAHNITNLFENVSVKSLRRSYSKTNEKFENAFALFAEANKKIPKKDAEIINQKIAKIREYYAEGFSETARRKRLSEIKNEFEGYTPDGAQKIDDTIMDKFWNETYHNFNKFMKGKAYKTFVSEELALKTKIRNEEAIGVHKYKIANSLTNMCEDCFDLLIHIDAFIEPNDQATRSIIKKIANELNRYKKRISTTNEDGREILLNKEFKDYFIQLDKNFENSNKYKKSIIEEVSKEIYTVVQRLSHHKRGEINEILTIYKEHFGNSKEFMTLLKSAYGAANSLEKSVDLEADKMFDKVRDLKIGSAPKDVLALMLPLGGVGIALSKAKTNDEKTTVTVKYGIPIVGAIAITMYCTVGLISAGPSLLIGLLSGLALNQLGSVVDNEVKRIKEKFKSVS